MIGGICHLELIRTNRLDRTRVRAREYTVSTGHQNWESDDRSIEVERERPSRNASDDQIKRRESLFYLFFDLQIKSNNHINKKINS